MTPALRGPLLQLTFTLVTAASRSYQDAVTKALQVANPACTSLIASPRNANLWAQGSGHLTFVLDFLRCNHKEPLHVKMSHA